MVCSSVNDPRIFRCILHNSYMFPEQEEWLDMERVSRLRKTRPEFAVEMCSNEEFE